MDRISISRNQTGQIITGILILAGLYLASLYNYLLFHTLSELFSIVVAFGIFLFAWNSKELLDNNYLLFLGIAFLFIGSLDLVHTMSYKGMGIFEGYGPNLPTQLWIGARYMESLSLFIAPAFLKKKIITKYIIASFAFITALILLSVFAGLFPDCYIDGSGLTVFKKTSEYIISLILVGSIITLLKKRREFDTRIYKFILSSIILTILSEVSFTFYLNVYGFSNLVGHYFKIISFYLIYKAIIETGFIKPFGFLFRDLKKSEAALREERDKLQAALEEVKVLSGLLPICSHCKNIRDDKGYWSSVEDYLITHSDAKFTHGICPECLAKYYPDVKISDEK